MNRKLGEMTHVETNIRYAKQKRGTLRVEANLIRWTPRRKTERKKTWKEFDDWMRGT
jgi:hypothetical protein